MALFFLCASYTKEGKEETRAGQTKIVVDVVAAAVAVIEFDVGVQTVEKQEENITVQQATGAPA